jgi:putative membrane-bound dehydrogenase-like protein
MTMPKRETFDRGFRTILGWALALFAGWAGAAEPAVKREDLPRVPPTEPDQALSTFRVKPGFRIDLVAAEPLVIDPIALSFDEQGRCYVVEMRDYSERSGEKLGRIRLLEDTDGDGRFDKSTVFAKELAWPTAVICWKGGVFVGATPDIIYLKDGNDDGVAEERRIVFTGFGKGVVKLNVQALFNSFTWSLDNRIHGATAGNGGSVTAVDRPNEPPLELRGRDFSFDPRTFDIRAESGGAQYGLSFDNRGRKFVCSNSSHIQTVMYEERYATRNPFHAMPRALLDIAIDGGAAPVYRISPDEPWRVIRTQWRVDGLVPGPIEGGGKPSGYFTGATGITIYRGDALGLDFVGDAFVGDAGGNLVHRKKVFQDGVGLKAARPGDEEKVEFLACTDNWFRPVQLATGADGGLYVCDMYREVIEHPWSLPESIKQHLDLNSGNDRGRLYRVVPAGFQQPKPPRLGKFTVAELVNALDHPNGWWRDTAARLLYERQDNSAASLLKTFFNRAKSPLGRLHALHALAGLDALNETTLRPALDDTSPIVRAEAVRLSERFLAKASGELWAKLSHAAVDVDPAVRYQMAFTLGEARDPSRVHLLGEILNTATNRTERFWMQAAILSSLAEGAGQLFSELTASGRGSLRGDDQELLLQLVRLIGTRNRPSEISQVLEYAPTARPGINGSSTDAYFDLAIAGVLGEGLRQAGTSLRAAAGAAQLRPVAARARSLAQDAASGTNRLRGIAFLGEVGDAEASALLFSLIEPKQPQAIQLAAVRSLDHSLDPRLGPELSERWASLTPVLRAEGISVLLKRPERVNVLLTALEAGVIRQAELSSAQMGFLRGHRDTSIRRRASSMLGAPPKAVRQQVVDQFQAALNLAGNITPGHELYLQRCATCHRLGSEGHALGPDLATAKSGGKEKLLTNILDPNREVNSTYLSFLIETKDGESVVGIISHESAVAVTLRQANGIETPVFRANILSMQSQGQSLMPEGLEAGLSQQQMADLLEFILAR